MWHTDDNTTPFVLISIVVHHGQKDVGNSFEPPRDMIKVGTHVLIGVEELRGRRRFSACMMSYK